MTDYNIYDGLKVDLADHVLTICLNRPEKLNAIGGDMHDGIAAILNTAGKDKNVRSILIRAEGRAFCVGGDLSGGTLGEDQPSPGEVVANFAQHPNELVDAFVNCPLPVVAAVQGYAMGLGATIALLCDIVMVAENAVLADTHVAVGLVAGDGGALVWPLNISLTSAKYYLLTGERISGVEAARIGLAHRAVPAADLLSDSMAIATKLAALPPLAVQGTKRTINRLMRQAAQEVMEPGLLYEAGTLLSRDHQEAVSAFMEKRKGTYSGS